jgi:hypothetical protein
MSKITTLRCDSCKRIDGEMDTTVVGSTVVAVKAAAKIDTGNGRTYHADLCDDCVKDLLGTADYTARTKPGKKAKAA